MESPPWRLCQRYNSHLKCSKERGGPFPAHQSERSWQRVRVGTPHSPPGHSCLQNGLETPGSQPQRRSRKWQLQPELPIAPRNPLEVTMNYQLEGNRCRPLEVLIREAQKGVGDPVVFRFDLSNAYGSIPHKLIETTLDRYNVSSKINGPILNYYMTFRLRVISWNSTSEWHSMEKDIIAVCTISAILLILGYQGIREGVQRPSVQVWSSAALPSKPSRMTSP